MIRVILFALLAYIIYLLLKFFQGIQKASRRVSSSSRKTGMMVKDNVCNTYLPEDDAIKEKFNGELHFFCSKKCRDTFLESHKKAS
ncbi:MAG: transcriptional regulator [Candidatus Aminicenantes bacterium]